MIDIEKIKEKIKEEGDSKEGEYRGYRYIVLRSPVGINLNGYVALPKNHTFRVGYGTSWRGHYIFRAGYGTSWCGTSWCGHSGCRVHVPENVIDVHGGLTYSGDIEFSDGKHYCLGFDTAYSGDVWTFEYIEKHAEYRNMEYVENECKRMIDQLILADRILKGREK